MFVATVLSLAGIGPPGTAFASNRYAVSLSSPPRRAAGRARTPLAGLKAQKPTRPRRHTTRSHATDAFFRHIVSGIQNGVLAVTTDGRLALINDEAYRIFDVPPRADDIGRPFAEVLHGHPDVTQVLSDVFHMDLLPNRVELRLRPSGRVIGYTVALVQDDDGHVRGATMFFKDLTRVEQLEERERLRDRLAAVGEMAAAIAHEVKNPLGGIEVMAGLLRRKIGDIPDAQVLVQDIINEAKMANAIVQEVLEFVRPIRLQAEPTSLAVALRAAVPLADTKGRRGAIAVETDVPDGLPNVHADGYQLTQLFTNLLLNAYEAMGGRGRIAISARPARLDDGGEARDAVAIEVADDGPGMASDVVERVFDPFFTTKAQGSGLGLAIVRKIVLAHDGRIDLRSALGRGTTISVTLPLGSAALL
jgi:signal transduction histidine kinase